MVVLYLIIGVALLILIHEAGHFFAAKSSGVRVEEFGIGFPPRLTGKKIGETLYSVNAIPFGGFVRLYGESGLQVNGDAPDWKRSFIAQSATRRVAIIAAGVIMNFLVGWLIFSAIFFLGAKHTLVVSEVALGSPAATSGLFPGDRIVGYESSEEFVSFVNANRGKAIMLEISRGTDGAAALQFELIPRENPPEGEGALGVAFHEVGVERKPFFSAIGAGLTASGEVAWSVIKAFGNFIAGWFTKEPTPTAPEAEFLGPVGLVGFARQVAALGPAYFFQLLAVISLNLSVLNVLPIPGLDGGRLLFIAIEKVRGRPVPYRNESIAHLIGFALLIFFMAFITIRDIARIL